MGSVSTFDQQEQENNEVHVLVTGFEVTSSAQYVTSQPIPEEEGEGGLHNN
jgi:hypothetical protein